MINGTMLLGIAAVVLTAFSLSARNSLAYDNNDHYLPPDETITHEHHSFDETHHNYSYHENGNEHPHFHYTGQYSKFYHDGFEAGCHDAHSSPNNRDVYFDDRHTVPFMDGYFIGLDECEENHHYD